MWNGIEMYSIEIFALFGLSCPRDICVSHAYFVVFTEIAEIAFSYLVGVEFIWMKFIQMKSSMTFIRINKRKRYRYEDKII